jgi:hypothetical protein
MIRPEIKTAEIASSSMSAPSEFEARGQEPNGSEIVMPASSQGATMNHPNPKIVFEARRLARAPGWYVRVAWPDGRHDHVPGFVTADEALRWIEQKAEAWLSERGTDPFFLTPATAPALRSRSASRLAARARAANNAAPGFGAMP